ncbi:hypothetical protein ABGB08_30155 [Acrocarpospora sp. B8E8]
MELTILGSRIAEFAGYMVQEMGDSRSAVWWTEQAVRIAALVGDRDMSSYALVRRSLIALYCEEPTQVVAFAQQVGRNPEVPSRIRWLAAQREAQGHALR